MKSILQMESLLRRAREEIASIEAMYRFLEENKLLPEETDEAMWWVHRTVKLHYANKSWTLTFHAETSVASEEHTVVGWLKLAIERARKQWEQKRVIQELDLLKAKWTDLVFWLCHFHLDFIRRPGELKIEWPQCTIESRLYENQVLFVITRDDRVRLFSQPREAALLVTQLVSNECCEEGGEERSEQRGEQREERSEQRDEQREEPA